MFFFRLLKRFAHINVTGKYDEATKKMMHAPRCGMPDIIPHKESERRKRRFAAQGSKWLNRVRSRIGRNFCGKTPPHPLPPDF